MRKEKINFKAVNAEALRQSQRVAEHFAPNGKRQGREYIALNPGRADKSARSFSLNLDTGVWSDFATSDKGGDLISYVAYANRQSQGDAARELAKFLGMDAAQSPASQNREPTSDNKPAAIFTPVYPPPLEAAATCPKRHPTKELGNPSHYWDYLSTDGKCLLMRVCRFDRVSSGGERKKEYRPLVYGTRDKNGQVRTGWHWQQLPSNRPLYGLHQLATNRAKRVILVEGEKACDAAKELFPNTPCLTWSSGCKALEKTDFSPLSGYQVWYWPDNDTPGAASVAQLAAILAKLGATPLFVLDVAAFSRYKPLATGTNDDSPNLIEAAGTWPDGADAFDACALGWRAEHLTALELLGVWRAFDGQPIQTMPQGETPPTTQPSTPKRTTKQNPSGAAPSEPAADSVGGFKVCDDGIYAYDPKIEKHRRICARIDVIAQSRDGSGNGRNWGVLVAFDDFDGVQKHWNIPRQLFAADGAGEVMKGLMDRGLFIETHREARRKVLDFLQYQANKTLERVGLVYKMGWHKKMFVLPNQTIGTSSERVLFDCDGAPPCKISECGTLAAWQAQVAKYCVNNPLALFVVSAAFSAPLLELVGEETMGMHLYGDSSWGKSTLLNLACSVIGNPNDYKSSWRSTDNAMESQAAAHSDLLFALDEINQVDSRIIGDVVYMLGNGQGKARANEKGQAKESRHRWRLTFLSNGEKNLEQYLADAGKQLTGGMEMRFIGIKACLHEDEALQKHMGVFNDAHQFDGGAALSDHLKSAMAENHGTAFTMYLQALIQQLGNNNGKALFKYIQDYIEYFSASTLAKRGGQTERAAKKFALIGIAGELATSWCVTGWPEGAAMAASVVLFKRWVVARGGECNLEEQQMRDHLRSIFQKFKESRFKRWDQTNDDKNTIIDSHVPITADSWGFRKEIAEGEHLSPEGRTSRLEF